VADRHILIRLGGIVHELRLAIGWSQRELAPRAGVSQSLVSAIENGRLRTLTFATASRLLEAMGARLIVDAARPFLGDRQLQREPAHARCSTYVASRLERSGWQVATEVEVGGDRSRGWIDLLVWNPTTGDTLVIEIKTELRDLGSVQRSLGWYEREALGAARRLGWRPRRVASWLLLLATDANDAAMGDNRRSLDQAFPVRARAMQATMDGSTEPMTRARGLAMIDPLSRTRRWLRPTRIDGRRTPASHADYIGFLARLPRPTPSVRRPDRRC